MFDFIGDMFSSSTPGNRDLDKQQGSNKNYAYQARDMTQDAKDFNASLFQDRFNNLNANLPGAQSDAYFAAKGAGETELPTAYNPNTSNYGRMLQKFQQNYLNPGDISTPQLQQYKNYDDIAGSQAYQDKLRYMGDALNTNNAAKGISLRGGETATGLADTGGALLSSELNQQNQMVDMNNAQAMQNYQNQINQNLLNNQAATEMFNMGNLTEGQIQQLMQQGFGNQMGVAQQQYLQNKGMSDDLARLYGMQADEFGNLTSTWAGNNTALTGQGVGALNNLVNANSGLAGNKANNSASHFENLTSALTGGFF
tara:strand:- start:177 stop:1112 length:936 start_codon:yes stop_codon:yes gene_type:complete